MFRYIYIYIIYIQESLLSRHNNVQSSRYRQITRNFIITMQLLKCGLLSRTLIFIALYYPLSVGLTFYNKWLLKSFKFPLFIVACHYCIKWLLAAIMRCCRRAIFETPSVNLQWKDRLFRIAPIGITASVDIGLSNWSLELITVYITYSVLYYTF